MKPCDCKSIAESMQLNEQGIGTNNFSLNIMPCSVFIEVKPYAKIRLPMKVFKLFAEWYLEDQEEE